MPPNGHQRPEQGIAAPFIPSVRKIDCLLGADLASSSVVEVALSGPRSRLCRTGESAIHWSSGF